MTIETGAAPEVPAANDRGLKHWRGTSFYTVVVVNSATATVNAVLLGWHLFVSHNHVLVSLESGMVALLTVLVWFAIMREQRHRTSHAGGESAVIEQQADTAMKELMIRSMRESGELTAVLKAQRPSRAH